MTKDQAGVLPRPWGAPVLGLERECASNSGGQGHGQAALSVVDRWSAAACSRLRGVICKQYHGAVCL